MAISHFFNKSIIIKRLKQSTGYKRHFISTGTIDAQIQRIDDIDSLKIYGVAAATHKAWIDISVDIREGDNIIDSDGNKYDVVGVSNRGEDIAMNEHKEIILNKNTD